MQEDPTFARPGYIVALVIVAVVAIWVYDSDDYLKPAASDQIEWRDRGNIGAPKTKRSEPEKPDLELLSDEGTVGDFGTTITGKIRNNTQRTYSYVQVTYTLYNKAGEHVGSARANTINLEAETVWSFKAIGFTSQAKRRKLAEIRGF